MRGRIDLRRTLLCSVLSRVDARVVIALFALTGCATYEPQPLDPRAIGAAFSARDVPTAMAAAESRADVVFDAADGVSLEEAEAIALVFNGDLRLARRQLGVAEAVLETSGLWEDPILGADLVRILESVENPWKAFTVVGFTIPISGRLDAERARAGAARDAEVMRVYAAEWRVRMELRRAWALWESEDRREELLGASLARAAPIMEIVGHLEHAGELSRVEARILRVGRARDRALLAEAQARRVDAELAIRRLMGTSPDAPVRLVASTPLSPSTAIPSASENPESYPDLQVLRSEYEIAERALAVEIRRQYPDLSIAPGYGYEEGQNQALLNFAIPIPLLNRNQQGVAEATAARELARTAFEVGYERVLSDRAQATARVAAACARRAALEDEIAPILDAQYAELERLAELGEVNVPVLLETLESVEQAALDLIDARLNESLARIRLVELLGPPDVELPVLSRETSS